MHIVSVIRKKTNILCICQKSELNSQEIGVFRSNFGNSSDHFEENGSQKDTHDFFVASLKKVRVGGNFLGRVRCPEAQLFFE